MQTFSVRDLRDRTGELIREAEAGHLSVVAKHGQPVFVAVPLDEPMLQHGVRVALAMKLFQDGVLSLGKATRFAGQDRASFMQQLADAGVPVVDYPVEELDQELAALDAVGLRG
jgi:prevent-host-death family protein